MSRRSPGCRGALRLSTVLPLVAGLLAASSGCYSYRSLNGIESAHRGSEVRARLTPEGRSEFELRTGRNGEGVEGRVAAVGPDSLRLVLGSQAAARNGRTFGSGIDTVGIPLRHVRELEAKELDARDTALLFGGSGLAIGAFVLWRFESSGGSGPGPGGDGGTDAFRPGLYLEWRW